MLQLAHLEADVNHQLNSALNIYRSGLAFFSKDETFVQSYVQFLLDHQQIENARLLLENSIQLIGMERCTALWEMLLSLQGQYDMRVTSLNELKMSEERFVKANDDRKMLRGMMGRMKRYMAQGVRKESVDMMNSLNLNRKRISHLCYEGVTSIKNWRCDRNVRRWILAS